MDTFSPPVVPTIQSQGVFTANVLQAGFGDGYEQTAGAGLNSISGVFTAQFDSLTQTQRDAIESFFVNEGGYKAFLYTFPGESTPRKFKCKTWTRGHEGGLYTLSAELREVFDLT